jgi:hypothetical protein
MVTHIRESWGFKLMYIPQEKPDTHDTYASHASPCMSLVRFLRVVPVRGHLSRWLSRVGRILLLSRNNGSRHIPQQVGWPIHGSAHSFSPISVIEAIGESQSSVDERATHHFTGPIYLAYDQYVQYLLMGANPSVLNRHGQGIQPCRCQLSTSHSSSFPTDGLPLST